MTYQRLICPNSGQEPIPREAAADEVCFESVRSLKQGNSWLIMEQLELICRYRITRSLSPLQRHCALRAKRGFAETASERGGVPRIVTWYDQC